MKRLVFPFLSMLMLGMSGCIKPGDNTHCFQYIPAIYDLSIDLMRPVLYTNGGILVAQEIQNNTDLMFGDALIINFCVNYDRQSSTDYHVANDVQFAPIGRGYAQPTNGGNSVENDFDLPIKDMDIFGRVGNVIFFGFAHENSSNQGFIYEMTYDYNATNNPIVYCRAKYAGQSLSNSVNIGYYAFNMNSFFERYKDADNIVAFKIQYKIGKDEEGNDQYNSHNNGNAVEISYIDY